ncbi:MAG: bile acid:sodium symporter [Planctomycetes bacterium]|nr:bile acid:sodium symporter [Planctomycetota bacterium]
MTADNTTRIGDRLAHFARRKFLWLLLASYALAAAWTAPGLAMRNWEWSSAETAGVPFSFPLLLLAVMLFSAAILTDVSQIQLVSRHPFVLCVALLAVWLGPALLVIVAGWLVPPAIDGQSTAGLLVGLALVATMPVANSSVGWTQNAEGNLGLSLALVVLSILLCPWVTPNLLNLLGMSLSASERAYCEALVGKFSGWFFIVWVILPTAAGLACRYLLKPPRVASMASWFVVASAAALLLLNYINSALALPRIRESSWPLLLSTAALAVGLSLVGLVLGWVLAWIIYVKPATRAALMFGLSMKHTGLALILAGAVLADQPLAILIIVLATLMQHLMAGVVQWWMQPNT